VQLAKSGPSAAPEEISSNLIFPDFLEEKSSPLYLKTGTVIVLLVVSNVLGNFSLSRGMREVGRLVSVSPWRYIQALLHPMVAIGVLLLIVWLISQLSLLSRVDLSYVLPITSLSYVLTALMGEFLLHERVSALHWVGIGLISLGVGLVARTVPCTAPACESAQASCEGLQ
jgi:drug/metabolite transporter (DMT)-like permease